jgi:DNA-binding response OmpR family regulator
MQILIAEDIPSIADILRRGLEQAGYQVVITGDGEAALHAGLTIPFDLAILDIYMPKLSGTEVMKRLQAAPLAKRFPIVLLTANPDESQRLRDAHVGAADYWVKPFRIPEILQKIDALLH